MKPDEIRSQYLDFFKERDHRVVSSSPVIPQGDPTLLFTNAGMNQFKDVLLGNEKRDYVRAASVQKCIRAGGKHNDLDEVGRDGRHLTFFEMLGNWSFGEYYKRESITWAWEFIVDVLKLPLDRVYVTCYQDDDESYDIWTKEIGVPEKRVARQGDVKNGNEENFWSMGPTGPCGPCTELHFDLRPEEGPFTFAEGQYDEDRVVEFWNLVFMESNRLEDGSFEPLPLQSVDTGMGLDRIAMVKAGVTNVFQTDLFTPIFVKTASLLGEDISHSMNDFYKREDYSDFAVIADHIRSVTFSLCDGGKFSNDGRGSVIRSILRRAVRHGRKLGFEQPFLHEVAQSVIEHYGEIYPELEAVGQQARELIRLEEERFFRTIDRGIALYDKAAEKARGQERKKLSGEDVFQLHATYGFPPDMTAVMAEDDGLEIDMSGYQKLWQQHQLVSKGKDALGDVFTAGDWITVNEGSADSFVGYSQHEAKAHVRRFRSQDDIVELLLSQTPFYAESGGQVGDVGVIEREDGEVRFEVLDTQKAPIGIVHRAKLVKGTLDSKSLEGDFVARIDASKRLLTCCNHTATHLLHAALRGQISDTIFQSGSLVAPEKLRFDFSWGQPLSEEELRGLEDAINEKVRLGEDVVIHQNVEREHAVEELGAMAIFGEKYGDRVRVVQIGEDSVELCGGTHVDNTRDINLFRITSESSVAAGIRRIEAVTNVAAYQTFQQERTLLTQVARSIKADTHNVLDRAGSLTEERSELERRVRQLSQKLAQLRAGEIVDEAVDIAGVKVIAEKIDVEDRDQMLAYADKLREKMNDGIVLLGAEIDGKAALLCLVTEGVFKQHKVKAGDLINKVAVHVDGRGGGRPTLAQAGGSNPSGLGQAVSSFEDAVREALG
jgi:alanyl-tRNA synthetase